MSTSAMARDAYHHGNLRQALIDAASTAIEAQGLDAFSLRETARSVGVSPSAAYRHFADRDALLAAVAGAGFDALGAAMRAGRGTDPRAWFLATGRAYVHFARARPATFALMFGPRGRAPLPAGGAAYTLLTEAIDGLGLPPETRPGAELVAWAAVHGLARLLNDGALAAADAAPATERVLAGVLRGLAAPGP